MLRYAKAEENGRNVIIKMIEPENVTPEVAEQFINEGFRLMEVEQAWDSQYYLFGKCPAVPQNYYKIQRMTAYPDFSEYLDAQVKLNSGNPELVADGEAQQQAYIQACLEVKAKYPKPSENNQNQN